MLEMKTSIQTELLKLLEEEELYWHKRSNINWLLKGDNNTIFFHRIANGKRRNLIIQLEHEGNFMESDEEILDHATNYKELFGPSDSPLFQMNPDCWEPHEKISAEENELLSSPFSMDELKKVVFSMEKNTPPGPDHIHVEFYQAGWDVTKEDLLDMLTEFGSHKLDIGRLSYGVITLIHKSKEASRRQQYKPICLLNVSFKIITKVLMFQFENCMSRIIHNFQLLSKGETSWMV
jgi:mannosylglycoprotein endo-beta-mannosidase